MNKLTIVIVVFLVIGAYGISDKRGYDLQNNEEDRKGFIKDFSGWVVNLGQSTKEVVNVAKEQEWLPKEEDFKEYSDNDTIK